MRMTVASTSKFAERTKRRPLLTPVLWTGVAAVVLLTAGCGVFVRQKDYDAEVARVDALNKTIEQQKQEMATLRADLDATRERLDNATRAYADKGEDIVAQRNRVNTLAGQLDERTRAVEDLRKEVGSVRDEVNARLDELKRAQEVQPTKPPPVTIPADKAQHHAATEAAYAQKDWGLTRTLGREYVSRYPTDDKTDDVLYLMGDADLQEGRPATALGEFNRVLKLNPKSNVLDKTLYAMGQAYLTLHDCEDAKLAFQSCVNRYPKQKIGIDAKQQLARIAQKPAGLCAPQ
ncbi:tetratricopeptide repeat protein [Pendulispora albinea]|uniref:Tetratricopeptide repeat protein n=1 Tax=Pendulispora albinea TaxID=2741071 RepID=A0ABZ2LS67_9BACT